MSTECAFVIFCIAGETVVYSYP